MKNDGILSNKKTDESVCSYSYKFVKTEFENQTSVIFHATSGFDWFLIFWTPPLFGSCYQLQMVVSN